MTRLVQHSTNSPRRSLSFDPHEDEEEDKERDRRRQEKKVKAELADLDKSKLQKLCRKNHLDDNGNEKKLRARLTKKMMEDFDSDDADDSDDDSSDSGGKTKKSVEKKYRAMSAKKLRKACAENWLDEDGDK